MEPFYIIPRKLTLTRLPERRTMIPEIPFKMCLMTILFERHYFYIFFKKLECKLHESGIFDNTQYISSA